MPHSPAPVTTKRPFKIEIGPVAKSKEELEAEGRIISDKGTLVDMHAFAQKVVYVLCRAINKKVAPLRHPLSPSLAASNYKWWLMN
jgi:hypothetical protein